MDATQERSYLKLVNNLEEMVKLYRTLLDVVRKEKELLIKADIEKLNENNQAKENLLYKVRGLDTTRERYAKEFAQLVGADVTAPRLIEMAKKCSVSGNIEQGEKLRNIHSTLEIIIKRVSELNKENEDYAQSALKVLNGAMDNIKDTLGGKKTYARQGKMSTATPEGAGNFVRKEA
jgi:flagellar biosynthesis/type III secretory pathway chaperone